MSQTCGWCVNLFANGDCHKGGRNLKKETPACPVFEQLDFNTMRNRELIKALRPLRARVNFALADLQQNNSSVKFVELLEWLDEWLDDTSNVTGVDNGKE